MRYLLQIDTGLLLEALTDDSEAQMQIVHQSATAVCASKRDCALLSKAQMLVEALMQIAH